MAINKSLSSKLYLGKDMAIKAKGTTQGNNNLREHTYMAINKIKVSLLS
jgi:hypothetical protein